MTSQQPFQIIYQIKDHPIQIEPIKFISSSENLIETKIVNFSELLDDDDSDGELHIDLEEKEVAENNYQVMFETIVENTEPNTSSVASVESEQIEVTPDWSLSQVIDLIDDDEEQKCDEQKKVTSNGIFICNECEFKCTQQVDFISHLSSHFDDNYRIQCQRFKLNHHFQTHYCNICNQSFSSKYLQRKHQLLHDNRKNLVSLQCDYCGISFHSKRTLNRHLTEHFEIEATHECHQCSLKFKHKETLNAHMKIHNKVDCRVCGKKVKIPKLDYHMKLYHPIKKYKCSECLETFAQNSVFIEHLNWHRNPDIFTCLICFERFSREIYLKSHHQKFHTPIDQRAIRYNCKYPDCPYSTCSKATFEKHEAVHERREKHNAKKKDWVQCNICPLKLRNKLKLASHVWKAHKEAILKS